MTTVFIAICLTMHLCWKIPACFTLLLVVRRAEKELSNDLRKDLTCATIKITKELAKLNEHKCLQYFHMATN